MTLEDKIMDAVNDSLDLWCVKCPKADQFPADITGPEEWVCSKSFQPGQAGCAKRSHYLTMLERAREIVEIVEEMEAV